VIGGFFGLHVANARFESPLKKPDGFGPKALRHSAGFAISSDG
jgi:hypothetical protein